MGGWKLTLSVTRGGRAYRVCGPECVSAWGLPLDGGVVSSDVRIQAATAENVSLILGKHYWWPNAADRLYRPVTTLSYLLNDSVLGNGNRAAGYHAVNLLLHLVNVWLLFALASFVLGARAPAFCAAAIWAIHPVTTEAVTNVAGRADLLATAAIFGALSLYLRVRATIGPARSIAAAALFAIACLGVFSKENAAVLLALMALCDIAFGAATSPISRRAPFYAAVAASLPLMLFVRWRVFSGEPWPLRPFVDNPLLGAGFWEARFTAIKALGMELWLLAFPLRLSSDRSYNAIPVAQAGDLWAWISLAAIAALLVIAAIRYRKKDRVLFWCIGFLAVALLPTSNLIVLIGATAAERFLYLPSIAFAIALAALLFRLKDRRIAAALTAAIVLLFAGRTWLRNLDWNDDLTLATADVKVEPASYRLHELRARKLFAGSPERGIDVRNVDEAIREGETAWNILRPLPPIDSDQHTPARLGVYYRKKGDVVGSSARAAMGSSAGVAMDSSEGAPAAEAARAWYEKSLAILLRAREISRASEKAFDEAQLSHGLPLSFRFADDALYFNLAAVYAELGNLPGALDALRYERALNPIAPGAYDAMARVFAKQGDFASAAVAVDEEALAAGPTQEIVATLQDMYARQPGGECAFASDGRGLNPACPLALQLRCRALSGLKQVFADARKPDAAAHLADLAGKQGCAAVPMGQ